MPKYGTTSSERAVMARALATFFGSGATLVFLTIALPHEANTDDVLLAIAPTIAYVAGAALLALGGRASIGLQQVLLAGGTALITMCVVFGGASASAYPMMYLWVSLYAYFFFTVRAASLQMVWIAACYAVAFLLQDDTPVPEIHWLMAVGAVAVGGVLIGRLGQAIRAQAADMAAVQRMSGGLSDVPDAAQATCNGLQLSTRADAVIMLEPLDDGDGLRVTAMAGSSEAGLAFSGEKARVGMERCYRSAEGQLLEADSPGRWMRGTVIGWAQPVLRDGIVVAILAMAWTTPKGRMPDRERNAALLFASEMSVVMDRAEAQRLDRERAALEINDNIVQGLVVAKYSAQRGDLESSVAALDETLERARALITDQLRYVGTTAGGGLRPGDLARERASSVGEPRVPKPPAPSEG